MIKLNKNVWIPLVTASALAVAASSAMADGRGCGSKGGKYWGDSTGASWSEKDRGARRGGMKIERMARKLDLSDSQKTQIEAVLEASSAEREALGEKTQSNHQALHEAMSSGDSAQVRTLAEVQGDLIAEKIVLRARDRAQISAVLSPEQREEFAQMKKGQGKHRH